MVRKNCRNCQHCRQGLITVTDGTDVILNYCQLDSEVFDPDLPARCEQFKPKE